MGNCSKRQNSNQDNNGYFNAAFWKTKVDIDVAPELLVPLNTLMTIPDFADVQLAQKQIHSYLLRTPLHSYRYRLPHRN